VNAPVVEGAGALRMSPMVAVHERGRFGGSISDVVEISAADDAAGKSGSYLDLLLRTVPPGGG